MSAILRANDGRRVAETRGRLYTLDISLIFAPICFRTNNMKCYQHRSTDAIGVCKSCGKAICGDCAVDLGFAITCPGNCEKISSANHQLNSNAIAVYSEHKKSKFFAPAFITIFGLIFFIFGFIENYSIYNFTVAGGLCFFIFGIALFVIQNRLMKKINA